MTKELSDAVSNHRMDMVRIDANEIMNTMRSMGYVVTRCKEGFDRIIIECGDTVGDITIKVRLLYGIYRVQKRVRNHNVPYVLYNSTNNYTYTLGDTLDCL